MISVAAARSPELLTLRVRLRGVRTIDEETERRDHQPGWQIHLTDQEICPKNRSHPCFISGLVKPMSVRPTRHFMRIKKPVVTYFSFKPFDIVFDLIVIRRHDCTSGNWIDVSPSINWPAHRNNVANLYKIVAQKSVRA